MSIQDVVVAKKDTSADVSSNGAQNERDTLTLSCLRSPVKQHPKGTNEYCDSSLAANK